MKYIRVIVSQTGGPGVMQLIEEELPVPGPGQVRIKVLAADVSFSDVNIRRGRYPGGPKPPFTPGYAMVGVVDQVGPDISAPEPGERVAALTFYGSYAQYICLPARELVPAPSQVDVAEAVSLVMNYVAAYQMLHRIAHLTRGQAALVHGAAGGVGTAFLELAQIGGLESYGTASKAKHQLVTRLGATPIDYRTEDFVKRIAALTGGAGVDAALVGRLLPSGFTKQQTGAAPPCWMSWRNTCGSRFGGCRHAASAWRSTTSDRRRRNTRSGFRMI